MQVQVFGPPTTPGVWLLARHAVNIMQQCASGVCVHLTVSSILKKQGSGTRQISTIHSSLQAKHAVSAIIIIYGACYQIEHQERRTCLWWYAGPSPDLSPSSNTSSPSSNYTMPSSPIAPPPSPTPPPPPPIPPPPSPIPPPSARMYLPTFGLFVPGCGFVLLSTQQHASCPQVQITLR